MLSKKTKGIRIPQSPDNFVVKELVCFVLFIIFFINKVDLVLFIFFYYNDICLRNPKTLCINNTFKNSGGIWWTKLRVKDGSSITDSSIKMCLGFDGDQIRFTSFMLSMILIYVYIHLIPPKDFDNFNKKNYYKVISNVFDHGFYNLIAP